MQSIGEYLIFSVALTIAVCLALTGVRSLPLSWVRRGGKVIAMVAIILNGLVSEKSTAEDLRPASKSSGPSPGMYLKDVKLKLPPELESPGKWEEFRAFWKRASGNEELVGSEPYPHWFKELARILGVLDEAGLRDSLRPGFSGKLMSEQAFVLVLLAAYSKTHWRVPVLETLSRMALPGELDFMRPIQFRNLPYDRDTINATTRSAVMKIKKALELRGQGKIAEFNLYASAIGLPNDLYRAAIFDLLATYRGWINGDTVPSVVRDGSLALRPPEPSKRKYWLGDEWESSISKACDEAQNLLRQGVPEPSDKIRAPQGSDRRAAEASIESDCAIMKPRLTKLAHLRPEIDALVSELIR